MTADAVGGVWTYAEELTSGLAEHGVEVALAVMGPPPTDERRERLPDLASYHHRHYALEWMNKPWADMERAGAWLLELADEVDAELVHLNGFAHGALDFGVPTIVVGHSCVLSWHEAVHGRPAGPAWSRYADAVRAGLRGADVVIAPTRAMLAELDRLYGATGSVIPNGRSAVGFEPLRKRPYVLGVGRAWDAAKNLDAFERVGRRLDWPVFVADGNVPDTALRRLYGAAAIFAEPARYEPFGLAALEAGLSRCALVLGDIASLHEVWGDAALFVNPFDDDALARTLTRLVDDAALRERLGAAARTRALGFSRERMADAYARLYARVTARQEVAA